MSAPAHASGVLCEHILQELIGAEVAEAIGAAPGGHSDRRTICRNGHGVRLLTTKAGDLDLNIPEGCSSSCCWSVGGGLIGQCSARQGKVPARELHLRFPRHAGGADQLVSRG
ncbi:transposase [Streptomyces sp. NPDC002817]|uniref:transposase n=1 Tax=Streptomyces sp. NPDC088357 TaxID=3154655 RepID=UPI003431AFAA